MAFKVTTPDGIVVAETAEDVLALQAAVRKAGHSALASTVSPSVPAPDGVIAEKIPQQPAQTAAGQVADGADTDTRWDTFVQRLAGPGRANQRRVLAIIKQQAPKLASVSELTELTGWDGNMFTGGVISGIIKNARKAKFKDGEVLIREDWSYRAGDALLKNVLPPP